MLIPDLYTSEQTFRTEDSGQVVVCFNPAHPLYAGHFPGQPVTPGVCLIQTATELLSELKGAPLRLTGARQIKFLQMHTPAMPLRFELSWSEEAFKLRGRIAVFQNETCIAKIDAYFEAT